MTDSLAAVVLAAGAGARLRPLSLERPKPLCPVGGVALVDLALRRARAATADVAVNVHHGRSAMEAHLAEAADVVLSVEERRALGTAGGVANLRGWIDGRAALITNADAWLPVAAGDVRDFVAGWDGQRIRLLCILDATRGDFGPLRYAGLALMPWAEVVDLSAEPSGLYETSWRRAWDEDRLDLVAHAGPFVDCGDAAAYLEANLRATGGQSWVAPDATVDGVVERSVVWPGAVVPTGRRFCGAVVGRRFTVLVR